MSSNPLDFPNDDGDWTEQAELFDPADDVVETAADALTSDQLHIAETDYLTEDRIQGLAPTDDDALRHELFSFTVVENQYGRLAKSYHAAGPPGSLPAQNAPPRTELGRFVRVACGSAAELVTVLAGLTTRQAIMAAPLPGSRRQRRMVYRRHYDSLGGELRELAGAGPLYRGAPFQYVPGVPGLLIIDFDAKDLPGSLRSVIRLAFGGSVRAVFETLDPGWRTALWVERPSSSSGVTDTRSGAALAGGLHLFAAARNGGDIPRYVRVLRDRLVLMGLGFGFVSAAGSFAVRSLIDLAASGSPFWLSYEADAVLTHAALCYAPGAREARWQEGTLLDTEALADLTEAEQVRLAVITAELRTRAEAEIRRVRLDRGTPRLQALTAAGVPAEEAERQVIAAGEYGRLDPAGSYMFDADYLGLGVRQYSGEQMLAAPERFAGASGPDPLERGYGGSGGMAASNKAIWYIDPTRRGLCCFSHAHGGQRYRLAYDAVDLVALWHSSTGQAFETRLTRLAQGCQAFAPLDEAEAARVLTAAHLPPPGALIMGLHIKEGLTVAEVRRLIAAADWMALALLALGWRVLFAALWQEVKQTDAPEGASDWAAAEAQLGAALEQQRAAAEAERGDPVPVRPSFIMYSKDHETLAVAGERAMAAAKAEVYVRGAVLVRPGWQAERDRDGAPTRSPHLFTLQANAAIRAELSKVADWYAPPRGKSKAAYQEYPNELIAATILSRDGHWELPSCLGIIAAPTLRRDLSILREPGLDLATGLYLDRGSASQVRLWDCLENPTLADARRGLAVFLDLLCETAFVGDVDRAVGLSAMITPVVRAALGGAPLHLFDGPDSGQGKSYVVDLASFILTGHACAVVTEQKGNPAELEKTLDAKLIAGEQLISFDNARDIGSERIFTVLSQPSVSVRHLGQGRVAEISTQATFFATGINVKYPSEMVRRVAKSVIDTRMEYAFLRQYEHDPVKKILADRGAYISAAIAIVRWFAREGRSADLLPQLANYPDWSDRVRSALVALGEADPVASMMEAAKTDTSRVLLGRFLVACAEAFPLGAGGAREAFTVKELVAMAQARAPSSSGRPTHVEGADKAEAPSQVFSSAAPVLRFPDLLDVLTEIAGGRDGVIDRQRFGTWLNGHRNRPVDDLKLVKANQHDTHVKVAKWQIERA